MVGTGPSAANRWERAPTAEELRERLTRKRRREPQSQEPAGFHSQYSTESLFARDQSDAAPAGDGAAATADDARPDDYFYDPADPWAVLGVPPDASWDQVVCAHRRIARRHHPDLLSESSAEDRVVSEDRMREVNVAYSILRRRLGR